MKANKSDILTLENNAVKACLWDITFLKPLLQLIPEIVKHYWSVWKPSNSSSLHLNWQSCYHSNKNDKMWQIIFILGHPTLHINHNGKHMILWVISLWNPYLVHSFKMTLLLSDSLSKPSFANSAEISFWSI